ncbi:RidA family protein [Noviherbaspirillum sp.]|uniref:RidA family protein n=1 Tax=Noviherbaspirillum sp. TaxID=1926288 RepID=UPI002FDFF51C
MIVHLNQNARMSAAVIHAGTVYLSGQVPASPEGDIRIQAASVLQKIDRILAQAGTDKSRLLSAVIYLADISDFEAMNEVWDEWVSPNGLPSRTTVQAQLANPAYRIEITCTAALGDAPAAIGD